MEAKYKRRQNNLFEFQVFIETRAEKQAQGSKLFIVSEPSYTMENVESFILVSACSHFGFFLASYLYSY